MYISLSGEYRGRWISIQHEYVDDNFMKVVERCKEDMVDAKKEVDLMEVK